MPSAYVASVSDEDEVSCSVTGTQHTCDIQYDASKKAAASSAAAAAN